MAADYTGTPGPTATATRSPPTAASRIRNSLYQALVYATLSDGHSVLKGKAPAGAKLKITKDFNLFTNRVQQQTTPPSSTPPQSIPTHLESSITVPASGKFSWNINPSVRPNPPYRAEGMVPGPNGFLQESWTLTCTLPDGTAGRDAPADDRQGPDRRSLALHAGRRRRHRAGDAVADARRAGHVRRVHAGRRA